MAARRPRNARASATRRLTIESLERRQLLAVTLADGVLRIDGTDGADAATIDTYTEQQTLWISATLNGATSGFPASSIHKIVFKGLDGDDRFENHSRLPSHAWGNSGSDTLIGGEGSDRLIGGSHSDRLEGNGGADKLFGGGADDVLLGGSGNDSLYGHGGNDWLSGEAGNDLLMGSSGSDTLGGGAGNDQIKGQTGADLIYGNDGDDLLYGQAAADVIYAGGGNDRVYGGGQNDSLYGEAGMDTLFGTAGDNLIDGGEGDDQLNGSHGNDLMDGGDGQDLIRGHGGDDTLFGADGADLLFGGDGNDNLYGGSEHDRLFGDAGNDGLFGGGSMADDLAGGAGSDRFLTQWFDSVEDMEQEDANVFFMDWTSPYTTEPREWSDADVELADRALAQLHHRAGTARILRDTLSDAPVRLFIADAFSLGSNVIGFNYFDGQARQIHLRGNISQEGFLATVVHEFGHNWDSASEENSSWNAFDRLHQESTGDDDFTRSYGQTNSQEDWATNWELFFGYYGWASPQSPSTILSQKQAVVDDFFANFAHAG